MMAGAAGSTPHSPTPLTPSGLSGVGDLLMQTRCAAVSVAVTSRYSPRVVGHRLGSLVEAHPFEKRIADAVRHAAEDLPVDDLRIDHAAAIMRDDEVAQRDLAGLGIDLDLGHGRAVGIGHVVDARHARSLPGRARAARQREARRARHRARDVGERHLAVCARALDADFAAVDLEILRPRLRAGGARPRAPCRAPSPRRDAPTSRPAPPGGC